MKKYISYITAKDLSLINRHLSDGEDVLIQCKGADKVKITFQTVKVRYCGESVIEARKAPE